MGELTRGSYRERLDPSQRRSAERAFAIAVLAHMTSGQRNELARFFRYDAEGDPTWRGYIVDLIEGREFLDE